MGCGFLVGSTTLSFQVQVPAVRTLSRPTGQLWPSELISPPVRISARSPSTTNVFKEVVMPPGATRGTNRAHGRGSGWARLDVNREDPVEMALAADLQRSSLAQVTVSSCGKYSG